MKGFIKFIGGWIGCYLLFAFICLLANLKSMDYADCLHDTIVQTLSVIFGWMGGMFCTYYSE